MCAGLCACAGPVAGPYALMLTCRDLPGDVFSVIPYGVIPPLMLLGFAMLGFGLSRGLKTRQLSRALHRHPWQRVTGRYEHRTRYPGQAVYLYLGSRGEYVGALRTSTDTGIQTILHVDPLSRASKVALGKLKGGEVWLAVGEGRGGGALPPGAPLFLVSRVLPGSEEPYVAMFSDDR